MKKKLISSILLICSKQNRSHSSLGYWAHCDLFYIHLIRSLLEIIFFFIPLIFFTRRVRPQKSYLSIYKKIASFEFRSLKLGNMLLWYVKLVSIINFGLVMALGILFLMEVLKFCPRTAIFLRNLKNWLSSWYLRN